MIRLNAFAPVISKSCRVLILGSMPSVESLNQHQYYAHPRNAFWSIIELLFDIPRQLEYSMRCQMLAERGVGVWDVLQSCIRPGSMDSAIEKGSEVINDFESFFRLYPGLKAVFFNGGTAERLYKRYVMGSQVLPELTYHRLPSTSPAFAAMTLDRKVHQWHALLAALD